MSRSSSGTKVGEDPKEGWKVFRGREVSFSDRGMGKENLRGLSRPRR